MGTLLHALHQRAPLPAQGASTAGLHPVFAAALAPLFTKPKVEPEPVWGNWTMLDSAGRAVWIVYAPTREAAMVSYPWAADCRPECLDDMALGQHVRASYGAGGT